MSKSGKMNEWGPRASRARKTGLGQPKANKIIG